MNGCFQQLGQKKTAFAKTTLTFEVIKLSNEPYQNTGISRMIPS